MDLQFFGANCIVLSNRGTRIVIDDTLVALGLKSPTRPDDIALYTSHEHPLSPARIIFDGPGEYEVADISIVGIAARSHLDPANAPSAVTMYKLTTAELSVLVTGHIHPDISESLLERIGLVDVLILPIGGYGYTLDPIGALKVIKEIEPKLIVPTHYADPAITFEVPQFELEAALKELGMEPKERTSRLRVKPGELTDVAQLVILERS